MLSKQPRELSPWVSDLAVLSLRLLQEFAFFGNTTWH